MADSVGLWAHTACLLEVNAPKAGNVHPGRNFADLRYTDFIASAAAIAPILDGARGRPVGKTVLESILATRKVVATNTNLGIVLLIAPLCAVPLGRDLRSGLEDVLARLTVDDARDVFEAIRLAVPGGMGKVENEDVAAVPTLPLRAIMALAADRDAVARQYLNGFYEVLHIGVPALQAAPGGMETGEACKDAVVFAHLQLMADVPDTLIARKCGSAVADEAARRARQVLDLGVLTTVAGRQAFADLDAWLVADGTRRNPGTSADLVTASLYVALRESIIDVSSLRFAPEPLH